MHFPRVAVKTTTNDFRRDEIFHRASERAQNGSLELSVREWLELRQSDILNVYFISSCERVARLN